MTNKQAKAFARQIPFHPNGPSLPDVWAGVRRVVDKQLRRVNLSPGERALRRDALREMGGMKEVWP